MVTPIVIFHLKSLWFREKIVHVGGFRSGIVSLSASFQYNSSIRGAASDDMDYAGKED